MHLIWWDVLLSATQFWIDSKYFDYLDPNRKNSPTYLLCRSARLWRARNRPSPLRAACANFGPRQQLWEPWKAAHSGRKTQSRCCTRDKGRGQPRGQAVTNMTRPHEPSDLWGFWLPQMGGLAKTQGRISCAKDLIHFYSQIKVLQSRSPLFSWRDRPWD